MFTHEPHWLNISVAQKHIQIYDDSVLKLSIKQGVESDRFQSDNIDATSIVHKSTSTLPGAFTMGELAYTRDTNRVFVGNFTNEKEFLYGSELASENNGQIIQQTVGGTLVGNKYLGYVDSKPPYNNDERVSKPLSLSENTTFTINGEKTVENGVLLDGSKFRSYEFGNTADDKSCVLTEDGKWSRQSYYNPKYDAYDGDYMYDIYRNALILFDHNIKPSDSELPQPGESKNSRQHSHIGPIETDNKADSTKTVYDHTVDMYGDGYVCLYNIIPDGDTLTFKTKDFSNTTGIANDGNYTQNVVSVQKVYAGAMVSALDPNVFQTNINKEDKEEKIRLQTIQTFEKINLPENISEETKKYLVLPNNLGLDGNVCIDFSKFNVSTSDSKSYKLKFTYTGKNLEGYQDTKHLQAEFVDDSAVPRYTLMLGRGLETFEGENTLFFDEANVSASLQLSGASSSNENSLTDNPLYLSSTTDDVLYTSNLISSISGSILNENRYTEKYSNAASGIIKHYDSENTKLNYLVQSTPILKTASNSSVTDKSVKFKISPVVHDVKDRTSNVDTIGIHGSEFTVGAKKYKLDILKDLWIYCKDEMTEEDENVYDYASVSDRCLRISHPFGGNMSYYQISDLEGYSSYVLHDKKIIFKLVDDTLQASIVEIDETGATNELATIENIVSIYSPHTGYENTNITDIANEFNVDEVENSVTIEKYITDDIYLNEYYRLEIETDTEKILVNIPVEKYLFKISRKTFEEVPMFKIGELSDDIEDYNLGSIMFYQLLANRNESMAFNHKMTRFSTNNDSNTENEKNLTDLFIEDGTYLIDKNYIFTGKLDADNCTCTYMIKIEDTENETSVYNFINNNYTIQDFDKSQKFYEKIDFDISDTNVNYYFKDSEESIKVTQYDSKINIIDGRFGISKEYDITDFFNIEEFYTEKNITDEDYDEWAEKRRIDIMKQFPIIPAHATSVILECETKSGASLALYHIGNENENAYSKEYENSGGKNIKISGLTLPTDLNSDIASWTKNKPLLNIAAETKTYIELPLSIDKRNNKHFSFSIDTIGEVLISLAAYRV